MMSADRVYERGAAGLPSWVRDHNDVVSELPLDRWMNRPTATDADRSADEHILSLCEGPTLDLGCGPGRFTAALFRRGVAALGIDVSAAAVELTRRHGGIALHQDIFAPLPVGTHWSHVLLADGNIGIGGDPLLVLRRARNILARDGRVVAEIDAPATGLCHERLRWETECTVGEWFPWARVGTGAIAPLAHAAGLKVVHVVDICGKFIVGMKAV